MVRGNAKIEAQKKAEKRAEASKKAGSQLKARAAGLPIVCPSCRATLPTYKILAEHMGAKHPGLPLPPEESFQK
ncbi:zinc finger protein 706 [Scenedesmus sp. PABB004]|nr:zinc finger protein 706 [Scenedesmus sp. PABB004]